MNSIDLNTNTHDLAGDDQRFDLLVDGELTEDQRRELLAGLDDEPGGWRRCALAFLEAQSWEQDFAAIRQGPTREQQPSQPAGRPAARHIPWSPLAMAATFLAALFLGSVLRDVWETQMPGNAGPDSLADTATDPAPGAPPQPDNALAQDSNTQPPEVSPGTMRYVSLDGAPGPSGQPERILLPVYDRESLDGDWAKPPLAELSQDVQDLLRRNGFRYRQQQQLVPLRLQDGSQLVVPVSDVELRYIGGPTY